MAYSRQRAQIRFNVAELDAVSAQLNLFIDAAFKKQQVVTEPAEVAGLVCAQAATVEKSARCEIGAPNVTRTYVRSCDNDFTAIVRGQLTAVLIDNDDFCAGHYATHRQRRIFFQNRSVNVNGGRGDSCLSGTIHVPNLCLWKAYEQLGCGLRCECFTAKKKSTHARQHRLGELVFDETHLCKRRGRNPRGNARTRQCPVKLFGIFDQIAADTEERAARYEAAIQIHYGQIERERRLIQKYFGALAELLLRQHPANEMFEAGEGNDHSLGFAGAAACEQDVKRVVFLDGH